ncbi:MAG TPA: tRNA lysidine(34) synthetase TilS [Methylomirabilota bacterium]|nr:tRNA lysidine(34) synthetase TilS [Methylomirabilota bacterium]
MSELIHRVEAAVSKLGLLKDGETVLVGVSGGADSMVLLHLLQTLATRRQWKLVVAHLNHGLRGRAADRDEQFVARSVRKLKLRFESARADVKKFARLRKISLEMAARQLRHEFLARTASALGISKIALAHHADDQVELFFLRLLRGSGTQGLGGMEPSAPSPADMRIALLRPLLGETKAALLEFARHKNIRFREDATNVSPSIVRNRIRHELLPGLRHDFQPQIDAAVLRSMILLREEGDFVTIEAIRWLQSHRPNPPFGKLHVALQRRVLQTELIAHGIVPQFEQVEALRAKDGGWIAISPALFCRRTSQGRIETRCITPASHGTDFFSGAGNGGDMPASGLQGDEMALTLNGKAGAFAYESLRLRWHFRPGTKHPVWTEGREVFDANAVGRSIVLRHWRAGDRFQPIGLKGAVKLQDWFVNQKIPRECRHTLVLATTASGEIFWVEGLRIGERFKVTAATKGRLEWRWSRK